MKISSALLGGFAMIGFVVAVVFVLEFFRAFSEHRAVKAWRRAERERFARRPRGKIVGIGKVVRDPLGREHPWGFSIDCEGKIPAHAFGPDGDMLFGNWTEAELVEVAKRRKEFEE